MLAKSWVCIENYKIRILNDENSINKIDGLNSGGNFLSTKIFVPTAAACFHSYVYFFLYFRAGINIDVTQHCNII